MIDVEIKKATSFFVYTLIRDGDASVPINESGEQDAPQSNNDSEPAPSESTQAEQERAWLDIGRQSVMGALVVLVLSEALMFTGMRWRHHVRTLAFLATLVAFSVVFPACYMLELGAVGPMTRPRPTRRALNLRRSPLSTPIHRPTCLWFGWVFSWTLIIQVTTLAWSSRKTGPPSLRRCPSPEARTHRRSLRLNRRSKFNLGRTLIRCWCCR